MGAQPDEPSRALSRRDIFTHVGAGGVAVAVGGVTLGPDNASYAQSGAVPEPRREALETLTAVESDLLEAIVARLIPSDENSPGAAEARAAHFIDRALVGSLRTFRESYAIGLAALDDYARSSKGAPFTKLSPADQDAVLGDVERNVTPGFMPDGAAFFGLVRSHTIQGTFLRPLLRRQLQLHRVGSDRLSRVAHGGRGRGPALDSSQEGSCLGLRRSHVHGEGRRPWPSTLRRPTSSSSDLAPLAV
jgi:hypothetical protein